MAVGPTRVRSFAARLMLLVIVSCAISAVLVGGLLIWRNYVYTVDAATLDAISDANIVAANCTAALAFGDSEDAQETLNALGVVPWHAAATLYDGGGARFAHFRFPELRPPDYPPQDREVVLEGRWLIITEPVTRDRERLGTLVLTYDLGRLRARLMTNVVISLVVAAVAMAIAIVVAMRLRRLLARPIEELVHTASTVSRTRDFSVRARKYGEDELGQFTDVFNAMLQQIESNSRALRESEERLRLSQRVGRIGTFEWNIQTGFNTWTPELEMMYGLKPGEFARTQPAWEQLVHHDDRQRVTESLRLAIANDIEFADEWRVPWPDGTVRWMAGRALVFKDTRGQPQRLLGVNIDITDRKRAEQERLELLESERAARSEAERASRTKDEFVATLSHELRTPLTAILGWAQMLMRKGPGAPEAAQGLEVIERNARVQTQIIEDLLDMSRIVSGKIRLDVQNVQLAKVIESALETVRPAAQAREIRLQTVVDPHAGPVRGDPNRLQQVAWNLLSNAIKFTPRGGRVQVALQRINSHIELTVSDSGEGISPEFLPHLFERFRQADASTTRRHTGLGLGLAIVKSLVELHGGTVHAASPGPGKGSTFTVKLPLTIVHATKGDEEQERHHPRTSQAASVEGADVSLEGVRVLVVDDEPDARELIRRVLEEQQVKVTPAASAAEAIDYLSTSRFDVIVSDIGMPGVDGYQLMRQIRTLRPEEGGATPAVALTAFARSEDRTRALLAGYQMHVAKPVESSELVAIIASLVGFKTPARESSPPRSPRRPNGRSGH